MISLFSDTEPQPINLSQTVFPYSWLSCPPYEEIRSSVKRALSLPGHPSGRLLCPAAVRFPGPWAVFPWGQGIRLIAKLFYFCLLMVERRGDVQAWFKQSPGYSPVSLLLCPPLFDFIPHDDAEKRECHGLRKLLSQKSPANLFLLSIYPKLVTPPHAHSWTPSCGWGDITNWLA